MSDRYTCAQVPGGPLRNRWFGVGRGRSGHPGARVHGRGAGQWGGSWGRGTDHNGRGGGHRRRQDAMQAPAGATGSPAALPSPPRAAPARKATGRPALLRLEPAGCAGCVWLPLALLSRCSLDPSALGTVDTGQARVRHRWPRVCAQVHGVTTHLRGALLWEPWPAPRAPASGGWQAPGGPGRWPSVGQVKGLCPQPCEPLEPAQPEPASVGGRPRPRGQSRWPVPEGRAWTGSADPSGRGKLLCLWTPEASPGQTPT